MHMDREKNLGDMDRIIRAVAGAALLLLVYFKVITGGWAAAGAALAFVQFVEAWAGY